MLLFFSTRFSIRFLLALLWLLKSLHKYFRYEENTVTRTHRLRVFAFCSVCTIQLPTIIIDFFLKKKVCMHVYFRFKFVDVLDLFTLNKYNCLIVRFQQLRWDHWMRATVTPIKIDSLIKFNLIIHILVQIFITFYLLTIFHVNHTFPFCMHRYLRVTLWPTAIYQMDNKIIVR